MSKLLTDSVDQTWTLPGFCLAVLQDGLIIRGNEGFQRQCAGTFSPGVLWTKALGVDRPDEARLWWEKAMAAGRPGAAVVIRAGGRWLRLRAHPAAAKGAGVLSVEDVTEEREAHERARLESEHFHALIERSSEGISLFDKTSKILYESPSNKRIHGYAPEEMEGLTLIDFCHPDDAARIALRFKHLAEAPGVVETEIVRFRHKQGHYIYLEGTVLNATDDPRLGAMVNNFRDVTGRLEAERELRRAKAAAEEAQRQQQHWLTNLTHEFKTPLALIRGPVADLAAGKLAAENRPAAWRLVQRNIERLDGLLTELIDLARLDAGTFSMRVKQHDLVDFIRRQLAYFRPVAEGRSIVLELNASESCAVFFDAEKLEKVLVNLLGNALKFSPDKTAVRVDVRICADADGIANDRVEVSVTDEGPGMEAETVARVFDRFFQGDAGLARGHEGMGIGMAIAREMVEMHAGVLTVESRPYAGSTFTFTLPLGCEHFDPDDIDTSAAPEPRPHSIGATVFLPRVESAGPANRAGHQPSLLLVEDNLDMRCFLRMHLDLHYEVREAENGLQALEALEEAVPDIILSDVMMPHLNGLELCQRIKANPDWSGIPVILLSAKGGVDHRIEGLKSGADDYLAKPFSVPELLERLRIRLPEPIEKPATATEEWVEALNACIAANLSSDAFGVKALALKIGSGDRQLRRRVLALFGRTPAALLLERRLQCAHGLIENRRFTTVAEVAYSVGLSPGYFSRRYRHAYRCEKIHL